MRTTLILAAFILFSIPVHSQEKSLDRMLDEFLFGKDANDSLLESLAVNDIDLNDILNKTYNYKFIYARAEYENKTYFSGQDLGISQYNISGQIYYQGSKGLNLGLAGIRYNQFDPKYNTTILTAGYNNHVRGVKGLNIRALYSRYFFAKVDSVSNDAFKGSIDLGATYQWKIIGSSVDFSFLMGKARSAQISWDFFADIPVIRFGLFNKLSFEPQISFYLGSETVVVNHYVNLTIFSGEIATRKKNFGLLNTMVRIPLSVTFKNFDLSAGYNFNFPRIPGGTVKPGNTSFFNLSLGYIFGI
jgi:hypothetical protein